jgi:hypothetical protein
MPRAFQTTIAARLDEAVVDADLGTQRLQALDVQVDRARADGAAAGQRDLGIAELRQQRAQHQHRGAHSLDQLVGRDVAVDAARVDGHRIALVDDAGAQASEQLGGGEHVVQARHVGDPHRRIGQQGGAEDRQYGVLGAGNADVALEPGATGDHDLLHQAAASAGVTVRSCNAWISPPIFSPRVA